MAAQKRTDRCAGCPKLAEDGTCPLLLRPRHAQAVGDWLIQQPSGPCPGRRKTA